MMKVTTTFLRGEVAVSNRERKKSFPLWKQQEAEWKPNFKKGGFRNQQRPERKQDRFTLLTKTPKEILAFDKGEEDETKGPMIIEAEMGGHFVHRMYVDGGSSSDILYEHRFNRFRPEVRSQMIPTATPMVGFSEEIIWPLGQISLLVKIGRIVTLWSSRIIPLEYAMVLGPGEHQPIINQVTEEKIQVAIHPEYLEQAIAIGSTLTEEGRKELLKNAGATYQRLVDKALQKQISQNLEVYVDDLVIKSHMEQEVEAVLSLPSLKCLKDVQRLNGKLASLNRFLCKSAEKSLPFFKTLKECTKKNDFQWTAEAEMAFKQMKRLIAELPILNAPKEKEELVIYLAAAKEAVSAVLMTEMDRKQMPIYFVSRTLQGLKISYTPMEKLILAGRLLKWRFELEEHGIHYRPRTSVKGQILADFIIERLDDDPPDTPIKDKEELLDLWILFTDGSSCIDGSPPRAKEPTAELDTHHISKAILQMGFDIARPFSKGPGKVKFLIVAIDYFTKWIEAKPVNNEALEINLDLLEEKRGRAAIQEAKSKAMMEKYYNSRVRNTSFKPGDLVYWSNKASHGKDGGKLRPKWEGPYKVTKTL
uniref:Reverse transcriptase/retrotransposon-derived protein RNase H-like domain-containing protein n=1 Tax=Tanacetum cinerariifolium TaxID=118510 RepID=A0A6L2L9W8_TANCI|nr:hypothetical protein [Tanacetum cinerariifolium]